MDYEKTYKEVLSRAKTKYDSMMKQGVVGMAENIAELFPELKESEDERIRKSLVAYFNKFKPDDMWDADFSFSNIVHWLEKQGSQNLANSEKTCKDEQKPSIETRPHSIKSKSYLETGYPVEQNPAWSEKNEAVLDALIRRLEGEDIYVSPHLAVECLKSLKDRVQPQQKWSEDDEKMFEFWNLYYEHKVGDMPNKDVVENLEKFRDWLKSLKERYTWKPSEEQMEAFEQALHLFVFPNMKRKEAFEALFNDLKKLKG